MDEKTLTTLDYFKILEHLASYASFSASAEMARALRPTGDLDEALTRQAETTEARRLLDANPDAAIGGAHDVRPQVDLAAHGGVLEPADLLDVRATLIAARNLARILEKAAASLPNLAVLGAPLAPPHGLVEAISRVLSERGEVMDSASPALAQIRAELRVTHERLLSRLERIINDPKVAPMLQEALITQRSGRYVVPLRAEFKGRLRSIVHDQSSSGATLFVEPLAVVELNNRLRELELAERDEVRRILAELSRQVGEHQVEIDAIVAALARLDLAFMRAKYAEDLRASEPLLRPFTARSSAARQPGAAKGRHPGSVVRLYQARHPLLDPATVVPIDVDLDPQTYAMVITGPNTGGKTVTLKTVGLLALMAQAGMHIPAQSGSELTVFRSIYADIGDEQSIEQSLSTFSGHITNIVRILSQAERRSLVLLDELGAGTDPQEGAALARAILAHLVEAGITCMVATHYPELKAFAHTTPGVVNASVEFDLDTLKPTYHLTIGLPGRSNALAIAERLGLPAEIIQAARATINPDDLRAEDLLDEIHRQRDLARQARAAAEEARREAEELRAELIARLEKIEDERLAILEKAREQAEAELAALRAELEQARKALARVRQPIAGLKPVEETVEALEEVVEKKAERRVMRESRGPAPKGPLKPGERVRLRSLGAVGVVTSLDEDEVEVQMGALRTRARRSDVQRLAPEAAMETAPSGQKAAATRAEPEERPASTSVFRPSPGVELDLRGQRADEALLALERHLESAYLAGLPFVRVIHGKGTGRLRQAIREALRASPHVASFEAGQANEGGDGVTIVHLAVE
jgi:DNA mismatch repair protein MutS2